MNRCLPSAIAWRYLWSKKSYSAVSAIAAVSITGVAVATAAIVCVLSVFNGFRDVLGARLDTLSPDIIVVPSAGKVFSSGDSALMLARRAQGVATATPTLTDNALAICGTREMPVTLKGVEPAAYARTVDIRNILREGSGYFPGYTAPEADADPWDRPMQDALLSVGSAAQLGVYDYGAPLLLFAPRREGRVNLANPAASFLRDSVSAKGIFQSGQSQFDENMVIVPIEVARDLFQYSDSEASAVEIALDSKADADGVKRDLEKLFGKTAVVKSRFEQQEMNFRMVSIEKWVTFLLLIFILLIASFNLISTLSMLVLEKQRSLSTLHSLGMTRRQVGAVYWWESIYVSALGGLSGLLLGIALCLLQEHFGLIKLSGDPSQLLVRAYPVALEWRDVILAAIPVACIGLLTGAISSSFARSRIR